MHVRIVVLADDVSADFKHLLEIMVIDLLLQEVIYSRISASDRDATRRLCSRVRLSQAPRDHFSHLLGLPWLARVPKVWVVVNTIFIHLDC